MSRINETLDDLRECIIKKLIAWDINHTSVSVVRDIKSNSVSASVSDGVKIYYVLIDEKYFYDAMLYSDLAMYVIGSINTLKDFERKR